MSRISLLVADDEPVVRAFIKRFICTNELPVSEILEAANGQEAISVALSNRPDLILLDIRMPGLNGLEAAKSILESFPKAKIIMVTAYDDFEYVRTALRTGVADYLLKPIEHETLASILKNAALEKSLAQQEDGQKHENSGHPLVRAVSEYVSANLDTPLRLDDIAAAVFVSPSHLSRTFSKHAGIALSDFIAERRKAAAIRYLQNTSLSVTEISERLGFSSATYFSAWFHKMTGYPPLHLRKKSS